MNKRLIPILIVIVVDIFGLMLILPLLPLYAEEMGASAFVASLLFSAYAGCQLLASPILGQLSDRVGRKPVLLVSQIGTCAGFILLWFANTLPLVFLSRIIDGFTAGNISVAHAYISDVTDGKNRARAFGLVGVAFAIGFVVGPALAGLLASYNPKWPIMGAVIASAVSIIATYLFLPKKESMDAGRASAERFVIFNPRPIKLALQNKELGYRLLQFFLFSMAFSGFFAGFPLFGERQYTFGGIPFSVREIGWSLTLLGLAAIPTQLFVLPWGLKIFGESKLVQFGYLGVALGFCLLSFSSPLLILGIAISVLGLTSSLLRPSLISLITVQVERNEQGLMMGAVQSIVSVCQIISPMIGGFLIGAELLKTWVFWGAGLAILGWGVGRKIKNVKKHI